MPGGARGLGIGTIIILGLVGWALRHRSERADQRRANSHRRRSGHAAEAGAAGPAGDAAPIETKEFVAAVLGDTEDRWTEIFTAAGDAPIIRRGCGCSPVRIDGGCGMAQSAMGPFYCPRDQDIYLDTSFFQDMQDKFGACSNNNACKFSEAYVIAHEVGHHVQDELGILPRVMQAQQASSSKTERERTAGADRTAGGLSARASGRTGRRRSTASSIPATSIRPCRRRPPSATTACKRKCRAMSCPTASPTALRSSASAGSQTASIPARFRPAIRWRRVRCNRAWQDAPAGLSY